ncbi:Protein SHOOT GRAVITROPISM like [Actinidia chinensis var. chinensis]|uniref:Protein SHOOT GRAVITROPISM like n=1 Tax=Actinidia chinensis var. chinensis TaxID=1590841 RepID=A0A2R6PVJ2_ACTCC|nr:Protein SHOOT GRAVITROPISM like [Actinidia chinensis var. chinensis]
MEEAMKELQLLPSSSANHPPRPLDSSVKFRSTGVDTFCGPSLDLQLSADSRGVEAMKWQAAEQIHLATVEKAYAEHVRELSRREMELAQSEFVRARHMWERAREEVDKAERMKERATHGINSTSMEITCQSCRQKFRP